MKKVNRPHKLLHFHQEQTLQLSSESLFILMILMNLLKNLQQLLKALETLLIGLTSLDKTL